MGWAGGDPFSPELVLFVAAREGGGADSRGRVSQGSSRGMHCEAEGEMGGSVSVECCRQCASLSAWCSRLCVMLQPGTRRGRDVSCRPGAVWQRPISCKRSNVSARPYFGHWQQRAPPVRKNTCNTCNKRRETERRRPWHYSGSGAQERNSESLKQDASPNEQSFTSLRYPLHHPRPHAESQPCPDEPIRSS